MKKLITLALASFAVLSFTAHADGRLNSYHSIKIDAAASNVWDIVKDFSGIHNWHPMFSGDVIKSGANNQIGAIRTLTFVDGPSFDEVLVVWDDYERHFTYEVIDPAPLPVKSYRSTMKVIQLEPGVANITWSSSYENNSGGEMADEDLIAFLNGAYQAGFDALKADLE